MLSLLLTAALAAAPAAAPATKAAPWQDGLDWHGVHVSMQHQTQGNYVLSWPFGQRVIKPQSLHTDTASPLFDGLFAMAQDDLHQDSVTAIRDGAFDHGQPIPCHCFETGLKWPYVWTRDLSYAIDLGLWRFDAARARNGLAFKLSGTRGPQASPNQHLVMQDTGSGGSWPISTDRVVWFLGAQHLLDDKAFAADVGTALGDTLAQDHQYAFDPQLGLYRGETSFLDWREQTYPAWTFDSVTYIGQSFALSTNVLHYQALTMAADNAGKHGDSHAASGYRAQAKALKAAINAHFWRADRGLYMSYIGGDGAPVDSYDLLGIALAITSGVADGERARETLANYPTWPAGSPVIWPERDDQPIYHNRAIWPFVSAYALRAARKVNQPARIAHEIESVLRGAALYGSNMENYELLTQSQHRDEGKLSGPVVNSPRQ
ncbi:MAG: Six-hairpin glycosidase-like protein, partial [Pseudomonadota bacterium]|nr:Six-hairpin glycosidase-like protein [Pseudomonadota bacterium]